MENTSLDRLAILTVFESQGDLLMKELVKEHFRFTVVNSTGGVTQEAVMCLLVGFHQERMQRLLEIVRENCRSYRKFIPAQSYLPLEQANFPMLEAKVGGARFYMMNVDRFIQL